MITLDAARALLLAGVAPLSDEQVAIGASAGRVLAKDVVAGFDQPAERRSAMDGYAVTAADAVAGAILKVIGEAYAGAPFERAVGRGEAVRIATGGVVPQGADFVVMQEIARREDDAVTIDGPVHEAHFVRPAGGDFGAGERLVEAGVVLGAAQIGLIAAASVASVSVRRRPRIAIFASGDELREPGALLGPGEVADSASVALAVLVEQWGGIAERRPTLPDELARATALIGEARGADLIVLVGGASVGDRDVLRGAVTGLGATILFDRIAVQPGKPSWHARFGDGGLLIGLPGNPASAFVCAHLLIEPMIAAMLGRAAARRVVARLAGDLPAGSQRETWWRARVEVDDEGQMIATPDPRRDSSLQRPLASANALLRQPADGAAMAAGATVELLLIGA